MASTEAQTQKTAPAPAASEGEDVMKVFKTALRTRGERAATEAENAVQTLVSQALADTSLVKNEVVDTIEEIIARIDAKLSEQMNVILHAPEFQKIEGTWRGLHHLVMNSETGTDLKIRVFNVSKDELYKTLKAYPGAKWEQSPLFKKVYTAEFGQYGGQPYGALIADYYFSHSPVDVQLLRDLSKVAAASFAPIFAGADPGLLNMDSWNELNNPNDVNKILDLPEYAAWKGLRDSVDSRYVGLVLPRVLARRPYGAKSEPVEEFDFEEETDGHDGRKYSWTNAVYAMGVNINRAFKEYGWTVQIRGPESGGMVEELPTHAFATDDGEIDLKIPTEISIPDRREKELSDAGLIAILHKKNTDKAAFFGAQSVYKPTRRSTAEGSASDNLAARLPYQFIVSRFSHYLKVMIRDKIGGTKSKEQLRKWLQEWLSRYVDTDPNNSPESVKAKKPLTEARIDIEENEENPGFYSARVYLKPQYQLEAVDLGLTLVSKLPVEKK